MSGKRAQDQAAIAAAQRQASEAARVAVEWLATLTPDQRFQWMLPMQQKGLQREWMNTEIRRTVLTRPPVTVLNNSTTVQQVQAQGQFRRW